MNALEIQGLKKSYGDGGFALGPIDLTLPGGCILGLIGENGAGKSTTIRLILNAARRDGGVIRVLGKDNRENDKLMKEEVGVVLDEVGIPECLTATEVGKVMADLYRNWQAETYSALLRKLCVPSGKPFKEFSRGMKMKLGIAVALSHQSKLLILDEPTSGLDPVVRDEVVELLRSFVCDEEHAILISSHIVSDLEKLCDYVAFLHHGKLLLTEEKDVLSEEYVFVRASGEALDTLPREDILHRRDNAYGGEAIVRRSAVPGGWDTGRVSIEELFVYMVKEERI